MCYCLHLENLHRKLVWFASSQQPVPEAEEAAFFQVTQSSFCAKDTSTLLVRTSLHKYGNVTSTSDGR